MSTIVATFSDDDRETTDPSFHADVEETLAGIPTKVVSTVVRHYDTQRPDELVSLPVLLLLVALLVDATVVRDLPRARHEAARGRQLVGAQALARLGGAARLPRTRARRRASCPGRREDAV